jgi:predicted transposase YbfD/YdcC
LAGYTVTIDAVGCQYKTAGRIVEKKTDYLFSLKRNQENLYEDVADLWSESTLRTKGLCLNNTSFTESNESINEH